MRGKNRKKIVELVDLMGSVSLSKSRDVIYEFQVIRCKNFTNHTNKVLAIIIPNQTEIYNKKIL